MIKFKLSGKNKPSFGFGISAENVDLLKQGKPIVIDMTEMGLNAEIMIFYGETTGDLIKLVQPYIDSQTKIHDYLEDAEHRRIGDEEKLLLKVTGYTVKRYKNRGWSCGTPLGMSIIRGWAKTEDEGWWFCWQHYRRIQKSEDE